MKPWQHGYDLDYLKSLEVSFTEHNSFSLSPFSKFKKNDIAATLHNKTLHLLDGAAYVAEIAKVDTKIKMFQDLVIGQKRKGDVTLTHLSGDRFVLEQALRKYEGYDTWAIVYAGEHKIRRLLEACDFKYVGQKITSFSEVYAVYFHNDSMNWADRKHPKVNPVELIGMQRVCDVDKTLLATIYDKLKSLDLTFTNHYSNYNTMDAWSALALRGYSADPAFITKPAEMNDKWHKEHAGEQFELQDTPLFAQFPEVRELLSFLDGDLHRVRFMRLAPGGGELQRHTDQVDPDAGNAVGKLARLHFALKTNPKVIFSTWDSDDVKRDYHYDFGGCWLIDTRKPHMAVNGGDEERIHLVVDLIVTPKLEEMFYEGIPQLVS